MNHRYLNPSVYPRFGVGAFSRFVLALTSVVFLQALALGAPATGTIQGRIVNGQNGMYLSKAAVSVQGTSLQALTDDSGTYTLQNVPAGTANLQVSYTGQALLSASVEVSPNAVAHQDFMFNPPTSAATATEPSVIKLNPYVVQSERFKNAAQLAINEEKNSVNIKDVVAADQFGDVPEGNVGEFVKYLPGVLITYGGQPYTSGADATAIQLRGFGENQTAIYVDGVPLTSAQPGNLTSAVSLDMLSINNASRIEVTKVPTPDMPMDSIGGTINLISKSAYEYSKPTFYWRVYTAFNSHDMKILKKEPGPADKKTYHTLPGADFTYAYPITPNFGFSVTGATSNEFNENQRYQAKYKYDGSKTNAAGKKNYADNPYLDKIQVTDGPRDAYRNSASLKVDWRPTPWQKLSADYQLSTYNSVDSARRLELSPDNPADWGPTFVTGKFKSSQKGDQTVTMLDSKGHSYTAYVKYDLNYGGWKLAANLSTSVSNSEYRSVPNGHFSEVDMDLSNVGQINFGDITDGLPHKVTALDTSNNPLDFTNLNSYAITGLGSGTFIARAGHSYQKNTDNTGRIDLSRELNFIPERILELTAQAGYYWETQEKKKWGPGVNYGYQYVGPASAFDVTQYKDDVYTNIAPGFGIGPMQWVDPYKVYRFYQANPTYFSDTSDDTSKGTSIAANNWTNYVNTLYDVKQTSSSYYGELIGRFFHNRLSMVAGIRRETDKLDGYEPWQDNNFNLLRNPDGTIYRDSVYPKGVDMSNSKYFNDAALQARLKTAGITFDHVLDKNSLEAAKLRFIPNHHISQKRSSQPTPSINMAYNITSNLVAKVGWAREHAKPDFQTGSAYDVLGRVQYQENIDPTASPKGKITIPNPSLKPWTADSWDFELTYYTKTGGKLSADYYTKRIKDFWVTNDIILDDSNYQSVMSSYGLNPDPAYVDWDVSTTTNGIGTASTHGYEFEVSQDLGFLGKFGKHFYIWATYTTKKLSQNQNGGQIGPTSNVSGSAGIHFTTQRITIDLRATHQNDSPTGTSFSANYLDSTGAKVSDKIYAYYPAVTRYDLNVNYQLTQHLALFVGGRNIFNTHLKQIQYDGIGVWPAYAVPFDDRQFGVQWTAGIRGTF